jgi:FKBP-type peptidyl-prolyl cis-trans isomerase
MNMNKKIVFTVAVLVLVFSGARRGFAEPAVLDEDTSYALGMYMASQFSFPGLRYNYQAFMEGFKAFTEAEETRLSMETAIEKINAWFAKYSREQAEANLAEGNAFLLENKGKRGVATTSSGLQYEVITGGSGPKPGPADKVRVNYEGTFLDGTVFDSSYNRGSPAEFSLSGVIRGWTEGIQLMSVGSEYRFFIPANLAYGETGNQGIPPNAVLIFRVELLSIIR